jgi:small subunit ribosomal protein S2
VQVYARAAADPVVEGKAAAPIKARGDDSEFVELDAEGNPVAAGRDEEGRRSNRRPASKKTAPKHAPRVADAPTPNEDTAGLERAEAEVTENEAADENAAK